MFEHSLVQDAPQGRRRIAVVGSTVLQCALLGAGLVAPLVRPEYLPKAFFRGTDIAPPPAAARPPAVRVKAAATPRVYRQVESGHLLLPLAMPDKVALLIEDPDAGPPVEYSGGVPGGVPNPFDRTFGGLIPRMAAASATPPPPPPPAAEANLKKQPERIVVSKGVQEALLVRRILPVYPRLAQQARIGGKVVFTAIIGKDGRIQNLQVLSGHPLLIEAAATALRQWLYRPTLLNGYPVEVVTQIEVNFQLTQ